MQEFIIFVPNLNFERKEIIWMIIILKRDMQINRSINKRNKWKNKC